MSRRTAALLLALAFGTAGPAAAATPFACRMGTEAVQGYLLAERFDMAVLPEAGRTEYRLVVQNPHPYPAAVRTGLVLHGLVEAPAGPVVVPPGSQAEVLVGWFPHDMSAGRRAPPRAEDVRAGMSIPFCEVLAPALGHVAMPMATRRAAPPG
jgi:hypothetical protein